ncbi:hypothetical protein TWF718_009636 [Orbilia javanica]|uniref:Uncharacterized protein n=1 Tax=Orbilia javanica TaxID=47235 RepID=A0AAN8MU18_9PEZI
MLRLIQKALIIIATLNFVYVIAAPTAGYEYGDDDEPTLPSSDLPTVRGRGLAN